MTLDEQLNMARYVHGLAAQSPLLLLHRMNDATTPCVGGHAKVENVTPAILPGVGVSASSWVVRCPRCGMLWFRLDDGAVVDPAGRQLVMQR